MAYKVQERWVTHLRGFRFCVIDRDNEIVIHTAIHSRAQDYADRLNATGTVGQWIRESNIELSDTTATVL